MKVAVLGDGLLGKEIVKQTSWDYFSRKKDNLNIVDITTWSSLLSPYDIIVNCIAFTQTYSEDKQQNWDINYKAVADLVDYCNQHNKKLVHISTDYLYTDSVNEATEEDLPIPVPTWYGYTKLAGDFYVQLKSKKYLICRESHKPSPFPYDSAWSDIITNGDLVDKIASIIISLIKNDSEGVFNVGTHIKSIYDMALESGKEVKSITAPHYVPKNTTMNLDKLNNEIKRINQ